MNKLHNILWEIVFILTGLIVSIDVLEIFDFDLLFKGWWTLLIIIPTAINLITDNNKKTNLIGFFVGIVLLLDCHGVLDSNVIWKLIIPVGIIIYGVILIKKNIPKRDNKDNTEEKSI